MTLTRIGFVGTGGMGQVAHLANYARLHDQVEIVAIAEPRARLAEKVAAKFGIDHVYPDADAMLSDHKLDGIVAPQQFTHHLQLIAPLYRYGLPLFTEKPLAVSSTIGAQMIEQLDASAVPFHMVGYHKRSDPAVVKARALIDELRDSQRWGPLQYARMTWAGADWAVGAFDDLLTSDDPLPTLSVDGDTLDEPYFQFINFYAHQINLLRHLLGERYTVEFADATGHLLVGLTESKIPLTLEMSPWGDPDWDESIVLGFERGSLRVQLPAPLAARRAGVLEVRGDLGSGHAASFPQMPPKHAMLAQAEAFVSAIRGDAPPPCEAHDAMDDLLVADQYFAIKRPGSAS